MERCGFESQRRDEVSTQLVKAGPESLTFCLALLDCHMSSRGVLESGMVKCRGRWEACSARLGNNKLPRSFIASTSPAGGLAKVPTVEADERRPIGCDAAGPRSDSTETLVPVTCDASGSDSMERLVPVNLPPRGSEMREGSKPRASMASMTAGCK